MSTDKEPSGPEKALADLEELRPLAEAGANQTQIRAFLEEKGWSGIKFHSDDKGNPGVAPSLTEEKK